MQSVVKGLPADGVLQTGDVIVAVDGQPGRDHYPARRRHHPPRHRRPDDAYRLRDGEKYDLALATRGAPNDPNRPVVGVTISTYLFDVRMPFPVDIESDNVGGPSAGFMFALGILDAVTDGDLTRGYYVAGTGTIAQDGTVGAVGGAAEKALAAEQDGAQVFLVPRDDADEAHRWVHNLQIVPIDRFDDGVRALCALPPMGSRAPGPSLPHPAHSTSASRAPRR